MIPPRRLAATRRLLLQLAQNHGAAKNATIESAFLGGLYLGLILRDQNAPIAWTSAEAIDAMGENQVSRERWQQSAQTIIDNLVNHPDLKPSAN